MEPQTQGGEAHAMSSSESPPPVVPAYSPHTQGFPPTSHSSPTNPFSARKVVGAGMTSQVKGSPLQQPPTNPTPPTTAYFLRPSKLEAGLGSNIFTTKHSTVPNRIEGEVEKKEEEEDVNRNTTLQSPGEEDSAAGEETTTGEEAQDQQVTITTGENRTEEVTTTSEESPSTTVPEEELGDKDKVTTPIVNETTTSIPPTAGGGGSDETNREYGGFNAPPAGFLFGSNLDDRVENVSRGVSNGDGHAGGDGMAGPSVSPEGGKRKWEETSTVTTGEEHESNVMQVTSCRLFAFDVENSNWIERGRGMLRLNDRKEDDVLHSRLIVRTKGSLRVMLNTPVFPEMVVERSSEKCVKITGQEDGGGSSVKLFLIQCSPSDAETLHSALEWRVRAFPPPSSGSGGDVEESGDDGSSPDSVTPPDSKVTIHQGHFDSTSPPKKPKLSD